MILQDERGLLSALRSEAESTEVQSSSWPVAVQGSPVSEQSVSMETDTQQDNHNQASMGDAKSQQMEGKQEIPSGKFTF